MPEVRERKKAWRRLAVDMFGLVGRDARRQLDEALAERVREYVFSRGACALLGFAPMLDEPDLSPFFRHWLAEGGELVMPVWLGGSDLALRRVRDLSADMEPGRAGILEPKRGCPEAGAGDFDLAVVPGRFFSDRCDRMGRGAGCYDVLLGSGEAVKMGVAYDFQIFPAVPVSENDVPMDVVVTPTRLLVHEGAKETL